MNNYIDSLPTELICIISCHLDFDEIQILNELYNLDINYEAIFRFKYAELYPYIRKIINMESINLNWKELLQNIECINYYDKLRTHKYNLKCPNDSYYIINGTLDPENSPFNSMLTLFIGALILKDTPNCYRFIRTFNDIHEDVENYARVYEIIYNYRLKEEPDIKLFFKTGKLNRLYSSQDIKRIDSDYNFNSIERAYLTLMLFEDPNFDKSDLNILIKDFDFIELDYDQIRSRDYEFNCKLLNFFRDQSKLKNE